METNDIYFNFSSDKGLSEMNGLPTSLVGNPQLLVDPEIGEQCLYLDGKSAIKLIELPFEKKDFSIECIFRNAIPVKEQGIYGSNGFRLALRSDRCAMSYTGWVNFPSSVSPKKITAQISPDNMCKVQYSVMTRRGNIFSFYLNNVLVGSLEYDYNFWQIPIYIGYYYDIMYAFTGFIKEFRIRFDNQLTVNPDAEIPKTLRD